MAALGEVLPRTAILFRGEDTAPYECDALTAYRTPPRVVVLPETEAQVAATLRICHRLGVPIVARGAGTGLSGGATPHRWGVVLSLAKFTKILKIDAAACTAVVQSGVRNVAISEAAAPHGLYYAPDPSSQIACTIGGNVAENSGGVHCLKYGLTLHNVLRVRGFMADGEPVEFGSMALDAAGLDLMSIVVGSEGMLAVTTEVTVKLIPKPQLARCIMAASATLIGRRCGGRCDRARHHPAGLELMDKAMTAAVGPSCTPTTTWMPRPFCCAATARPRKWPRKLPHGGSAEGRGASRFEVSCDETQRLKFWAAARMPFRHPAGSVRTTCAWIHHPRKRLAEMLRRSRRWRPPMVCVASTSFMPATAICIP